MAADLGRDKYVKWRDDVYNLLMLADGGLEEECYHLLNWVMAGQGQIKNNNGGVKWVSNPHVGVKGKSACHSDVECSYLPRGTYTDCRGVESYPVSN